MKWTLGLYGVDSGVDSMLLSVRVQYTILILLRGYGPDAEPDGPQHQASSSSLVPMVPRLTNLHRRVKGFRVLGLGFRFSVL